jgi:inhibitor of KinA
MAVETVPVGDAALLVRLGETIDPALNRRVHALARRLEQAALPGVEACVPAYAALMVYYDPLRLSAAGVEGWVRACLGGVVDLPPDAPRRVEIPTVYGGEFGPDLEFVAIHNHLSQAEVVRIHTGADYPVYMLGFMPGFPFLGGMSARIAAPRLDTPRTRLPAGSVGIAGSQTGIYPLESPGGWRLIGRTPLRLFDPQRRPPALLAPGDLVRFVSVDNFEIQEDDGAHRS